MSSSYIPNSETKEAISVRPTISSGSKSSFTEYTKNVLQHLDEQNSCAGTPPHTWYPLLVHILPIPTPKNPLDTQSGDLSQGQIPILNAIKLKAQKTRDNLKSCEQESTGYIIWHAGFFNVYRDS